MAFWNDPSALLPKQSHRWVISLGEHLPENQQRDTIPHYFAKSADRPSYKIETIQAKYLYAHTFNFPKRLQWNPIKIEFNDVLITEPGTDNVFKDFIRSPKIARDGSSVISNYEEQNSTNTTTSEGLVTTTRRPLEARLVTPQGSIGDPVPFDTERKTTFKPRRSPFEVPENKQYQKSTQLFFYQFLQKCGYFDPNELEREDQLLRFRSYHFKKNMVGALNGRSVDLLNNNSTDYSSDFIVLNELDGDGNVIEYWKIYNPIITDISPGKLDYSADNILNITVGITYDWAELVPMNGVAPKQQKKPSVSLPEDDIQNEIQQPLPSIDNNDSNNTSKEINARISGGPTAITRNTTITTETVGETYQADENGRRLPGTSAPVTALTLGERLQLTIDSIKK